LEARGFLLRRELPVKSKLYRICTVFLVLTIALVFAASCVSPPESTSTLPTEVIDQLGRTVALDKPPQRIISLAPSNSEILFALGLADRVVAVTDYCNYPPEAEAKPTIGGFSTPNMEAIVALSPDLILATSIHEAKIIPQLEGRGLNVLALNPKTIEGVLEAIALTGAVVGVEERASELVAGMRQRIKAVTGETAGLPPEQRPATCYIVWHDPLMIGGSGTLQDELIEKAGGMNIAGMLSSYYAIDLTDYAKISLETFMAADPEVIIAGVGHGSGQDQTFQYAQTEPRLRDTDARRHDRIYAIDADLTSRPGPRIVEGLEEFARFIHPELFN
jgi:iron complex transport system substrate-binding protein